VPVQLAHPTEVEIFNTGDVLSASAVKPALPVPEQTRADMTVRAFIKTLGVNELGWSFQTNTRIF
jgi:hypothetical protein